VKLILFYIANDNKALSDAKRWLKQKEIKEIIVITLPDQKEDFPEPSSDDPKITITPAQPDITGQIYELIQRSNTEHDILFIESGMWVEHDSIITLKETLDAAEKNGIASPRYRHSQYEHTLSELPPYNRIYNIDTSCLLIKRAVFDYFWLLCDFEGLASIFYILQNFCLFVCDFGYSTIRSNRAVVQQEKRSPLPDREQQEILDSRYPHYEKLCNQYQRTEIHALEHFSEVLSDADRKKKILIDLIQLQACYNGTNEYSLSLLWSFIKNYNEMYDIHVFVPEKADEFHGLTSRGLKTIHTENNDQIFDIVIVTFHHITKKHQVYLNQNALKIVFCVLDIIMLRCNYIKTIIPDMDDIFRMSFKLTDGLICISDSTKKDLLSYYADVPDLLCKQIKTIRPAPKTDKATPTPTELPFDQYILIMGSPYKHKMLSETVETVCNSEHNFIVVGLGKGEFLYPNVYGYSSGNLDAQHMAYLFNKCEMLIFPSCYEGFGLPVFEALTENKPTLLMDNEMNRELRDFLPDFHEHFHLFKSLNELNSSIKAAKSKQYKPGTISWTWDKHAGELNGFIKQILKTEVNVQRLNERWQYFNAFDHTVTVLEKTQKELADTEYELGITQNKLGIIKNKLMDTQYDLEYAQDALMDTKQALDNLLSSRSYRLTRKCIAILCPPNSIRRRIATRIISAFAR